MKYALDYLIFSLLNQQRMTQVLCALQRFLLCMMSLRRKRLFQSSHVRYSLHIRELRAAHVTTY